MTRRLRRGTARGFALAIMAAAATACGGSDKGTGPVPCDTYTGGIIAPNSGGLPGTYALKSLCQGMKPDVAGASGTVTITQQGVNMGQFDATITGQPLPYIGTYTTNGDGIVVDLTSPVAGQVFVGTFRLRNDSLAVSGAVGTLKLSLVGTRL